MKLEDNYQEINLVEAQKIMLDILIQFDEICKENGLTYWLTAGTLLGAVVHKGFIPWDDDIDVAMPREDFNKFNKLKLPQNLFMQNKKTDPSFTQFWTKIRDKNSLYIEKDELGKDIKYHRGIFIDIFPMNCINGKIMKIYPTIQNILRILTSSNRFYNKWIEYDFRIPAIAFLNKFNNSKNDVFLESIDTGAALKAVYKKDIYPLKKITFNGYLFPVPQNTDSYLTVFYGSTYNEPCPLERRVTHNHKIYVAK